PAAPCSTRSPDQAPPSKQHETQDTNPLVLRRKKHTCHSSTNGYNEATPAQSNWKESENDRIRNRRRTHLLPSTHTHRRNQRSRHRQRQMAHIRTHRNRLDGG